MLTIHSVRKQLRAVGITLVRNEALEFMVYPKGTNANHPSTYFTTDLQDALGTGLAMAKCAV